MIFENKSEGRLALRVLVLFGALLGTAYFLVAGNYVYTLMTLPLVFWSLYSVYQILKKAQEEVKDFVESIHYRDFSRNFNVKKAPAEVQTLRQGFNEINSTVRVISQEKELQYQFLQQILELVNTGIISFDTQSGELNWMNSAFKKLLGIPYLKTVQSLAKRNEALYQAVIAIRPNETNVISINREHRQVKILLSASLFQIEGKTHKLIAFQNIHDALDENEAQAWQKLLSVMTHEIMNSVAPISSLADTLKKQVSRMNTQRNMPGADTEKDDLELGLETIKRRSEGLLNFAEIYRKLNKVTKPLLKKVLVRDVFENLLTLMQPTFEKKNIDIDVILKDPQLAAEMDINLIEQVLINLLVNAIEAVKDKPDPKITLSAVQENNRLILKITDNGTGIPFDLLDKIFIPFFSTKKNGSGIGLSLSKQIMLLHRGTIRVQSILGEGSSFILLFPTL
jgi:signal transduction histidine kinase